MKKYSGVMLERLLAYFFDEPVITELGLKNATAQYLLKDYYNQPRNPIFVKHVRELENKKKEKYKRENRE